MWDFLEGVFLVLILLEVLGGEGERTYIQRRPPFENQKITFFTELLKDKEKSGKIIPLINHVSLQIYSIKLIVKL